MSNGPTQTCEPSTSRGSSSSPISLRPAADSPPKCVQDDSTTLEYPYHNDGPLRKVHPYNHTFLTYAKARWLGREILEIFTNEFRDRSKEFYAWAISNGTVMVNGHIVDGSYVIQNGDLISNVLHRHEPPILGGKIKIYHRDDENGIWVVEKKASMPIHSTGRYKKNTLLDVLKNEYGLQCVQTANRLDRLVSGIMIIAITTPAARKLGKAFQTPGTVHKEYVARVLGCFPEEEIICEEPLLSIDKQIGVNVVHPDGRPSKTIFKRLSYDPPSNTSVVRCRPITGRSHQLRVHLQYLGHPIANDPIYNDVAAWGDKGGKGGLFGDNSDFRTSSVEHDSSVSKLVDTLAASMHDLGRDSVDIHLSKISDGAESPLEPPTPANELVASEKGSGKGKDKGKDPCDDKRSRFPEFNSRKGASLLIDDELKGGSEVGLVPQAVQAILHLRKLRDREDNYARYRDMERPIMPRKDIFKPTPSIASVDPSLPSSTSSYGGNGTTTTSSISAKKGVRMMTNKERDAMSEEIRSPELIKLQKENPDYYISEDDKGTYCNVCGTPLLPDPKPEQLSIWLHAIRYHTDEWDYSSPLPDWAREDWQQPQGS